MPRRLISAPGTTTDRWVYLLMFDVAVRGVVVMATCFSKNAKGPRRPGDPPAIGTDQTCLFLLDRACRDLLSRACGKERSGPPRVLEPPGLGREWEVMLRGRGPRGGCPPPEGVDVAYPPKMQAGSVADLVRLASRLGITPAGAGQLRA